MAESELVRGFSPSWRTHPGKHLEEYLETRGWSQAEFARRAGMTPKLVSEILNAKNPVTPETALRLQRVLGLNAEIWMDLQSKWDLHQARKRAEKEKPNIADWLADFPVRELKQRGALPNTNNEAQLTDGLCRLFGIGVPRSFVELQQSMAVQHRQSKVGEARQGHIIAWLVLGEMKAREMDLPAFDANKFISAVKEIRDLTREEPEVFEPEMISLCRDAGVAVVFEKPISKTKLFGSARWFNGSRNAIIQLSLRMKFNDHLWWTFFHECGHIALHRGKNFADDQNGDGDGLEHEADEWAEQILYGPGGARPVIESFRDYTRLSVQRAAIRLNLHPGILVGMLQHYGEIHFRNLNDLKARFEWADEI